MINHQAAYNWLAEMAQRSQRPELAMQQTPHDMRGIPMSFLNGGMPAYPTNNWVSPPMGQTPLGMQAGPGQADLETIRRMRGW